MTQQQWYLRKWFKKEPQFNINQIYASNNLNEAKKDQVPNDKSIKLSSFHYQLNPSNLIFLRPIYDPLKDEIKLIPLPFTTKKKTLKTLNFENKIKWSKIKQQQKGKKFSVKNNS
jgi:hypothetical protein